MMNTLFRGAAAIALLGLAACSSTPTPAPTTETPVVEKKPAGPPEPVAAKTAYYEMYTPAHSWATDLVGLSLVSGDVAGVKNADGKFGMWTAVFASPSLHQARTYTYAVADALPAVQKGVKAESPIPWAGPNTKVMPFDNSDFKTDSDAAYTAALEKAGDWVKEHQDKTPVLTLGNTSRFPTPVWYILWGDAKSGYVVFVNAVTGQVVQGK